MKDETIILYEPPIPEWECYGVYIEETPRGLDSLVHFIYYNADGYWKGTIIFHTVGSLRFSNEYYTTGMLKCYDTLVEVKNSTWLNSYGELVKKDYCERRHFAIYIGDFGYYEAIAESCSWKEPVLLTKEEALQLGLD